MPPGEEDADAARVAAVADVAAVVARVERFGGHVSPRAMASAKVAGDWTRILRWPSVST